MSRLDLAVTSAGAGLCAGAAVSGLDLSVTSVGAGLCAGAVLVVAFWWFLGGGRDR